MKIKNVWDDPDADVRWRVAGNPSTSAETLKKLADDPDEGVRWWAANNPRTPAETIGGARKPKMKP